MRKLAQRIVGSVALLSIVALAGGCFNYSQGYKDAVVKAFGSDYKNFHVFSFPVDNFGVGTIYVNMPNFQEKNVTNPLYRRCIGAECYGVQDVPLLAPPWDPSDEASKRYWSLNNHANLGKSGSISIAEKSQQEAAIKVIIPEIYKIVGGKLSFEEKWVKTSTFKFGSALVRDLKRQGAESYIKNHPDAAILKAYTDGKLIVTVADVVLTSVSMNTCLDLSVASELQAKLLDSVNNSNGTAVLKGASIEIKVSGGKNGCYELVANHPVIAAVLVKPLQKGSMESLSNTPSTSWDAEPTVQFEVEKK